MSKDAKPKIGGIILSRRPGQEIWINLGMVVITVTKVQGNQVMLRLQAPPEVKIDRREHLDELVNRGELSPEILERK